MDIGLRLAFPVLMWTTITVTLCSKEELIQKSCDNDTETCYFLYKDDDKVSFLQAFQKCREQGQELATIMDRRSQDVISRLKYVHDNKLAWLAGEISKNDTWRALNGNPVSDISFDEETDFRCSAYQAKDKDHSFFAVPCKIPSNTNSNLRLSVCQMPLTNGLCSSGKMPINDHCYGIPGNWTYTAFDGQTICNSISPNSTLAYTSLSSEAFESFLFNDLATFTQKDAKSRPEVWTGVYRNPWVWLTGSPNRREVIVKYSQWQTSYGTSDKGRCLTISLNSEKMWENLSCDRQLEHYLCQGKMPVTGTGTGTDTASGSATSTVIIIIASVTAVLVFIIVIVSVLIFLRCSRDGDRRTANKDDSGSSVRDNRKSEMGTSSVGDATNRDLSPVYFELTPNTCPESQQNGSDNNDFFWGQG